MERLENKTTRMIGAETEKGTKVKDRAYATSRETQVRSQLSTATIIKWLRTHFHNKGRKNFHYLYFPQELIRETSIEQIFVEFDADGSGGLSRDQVFDMFNGFGIPITMTHLNALYDSVEVDLEELDCERFKKCALSEGSNQVFREIVRELKGQYLPHNFTSMIVYLVYLSKRAQLRKEVSCQGQTIERKVEKMSDLLRLKDLAVNNERLHIHSGSLKNNLKNRFREVWQSCNSKHRHKFSHTLKLEQEFYRFCKQKEKEKERERDLQE